MRRNGWIKKVAPPQADTRPAGLPPKPFPGVGDIGRCAPIVIHVHVSSDADVERAVREALRGLKS